MLQKLFKYFPNKEAFDSVKVSAIEDDSSYIIGDSALVVGTPDILWENIVFIEEEHLIWTHGEFYTESEYTPLTDEEIISLMPIEDEE